LCSQPTEYAHIPRPAVETVSCHIAEQLGLQDVLSFLIFLARLKRLIILPAYRLVTLSARNISHDVSAGRHVPLTGIAGRDVDDVVKEVCFAMLAPEISAYDIFMIREVRLAVLAAVDLVAIEIDVVGETHGPDLGTGCGVFCGIVVSDSASLQLELSVAGMLMSSRMACLW